MVSDVLSDPQMGALALAKSKLTLAIFSRAQEFEADGIGVGISARAGFDPYGASRFLTDMQRNAELKTAAAAPTHARSTSLHPSGDARAGEERARQRPPVRGPGTGERDRDRISRRRRRHGLWRGPERRLRARPPLPASQARLHLPGAAGFDLDNTAQAVLGLKGGDEALRLDVVSVPAEQSLADYLKSGWIENVDPASVEDFTVNGFPAATATASGEHWSFRLFAVRFGSDVYRFIFAAKNHDAGGRPFVPRVDRDLPPHEPEGKREVKPLHIKIVTVGANDTVETLARRMAVGDHRLERFRVLNGLGPHDAVKPGRR